MYKIFIIICFILILPAITFSKELNKDDLLLVKEFAKEINSGNSISTIISIIAIFISSFTLFLHWRKEKYNVEITPKSVHTTNGIICTRSSEFKKEDNIYIFGIEILNLSHFDILIKDIGFLPKNKLQDRYAINAPYYDLYKNELEYPLSIKAQDSIVIAVPIEYLKDIHISKVYVKLSNGKQFTGNSKAFKDLLKSFAA